MRLLKPPYDVSTAMLKIADTTWRALFVIVLVPCIVLGFVLLSLGSILRNAQRMGSE